MNPVRASRWLFVLCVSASVLAAPACKDDEEEAAGEEGAKSEGEAEEKAEASKEGEEAPKEGEEASKEGEEASKEGEEAPKEGEEAAEGDAAKGEEPSEAEEAARGTERGAAARPGAVPAAGPPGAVRPAPGAVPGEGGEGAAPGEEPGAVPGAAPGAIGRAGAPEGAETVAGLQAERERRIAELKARAEERRRERLGVPPGAPGEVEAETGEPAGEEAEALEPAAEVPPMEAPVPGGHLVPAGGQVLEIGRYLTIADVRTLTGDRTLAPAGSLSGIPASDTYNSLYFAPPVRVNFGLSLQVWKEKTRRDANERYRRMEKEYPNAEDTPAVPPKSFLSQWNDILALSFTDLTKRVIVSVSCHQNVCTPAELVEVAKLVKSRI
jgi:hypothetical protein